MLWVGRSKRPTAWVMPVCRRPSGPELDSPPKTPRMVSGLFSVARLGAANIAPESNSMRMGPWFVALWLLMAMRRALLPLVQLESVGLLLERRLGPPLKRGTEGTELDDAWVTMVKGFPLG